MNSFNIFNSLNLFNTLNLIHPGSLVIFPEGFKSNGSVILDWLFQDFFPSTSTLSTKEKKDFLESVKEKVVIVGIQYSKDRWDPSHTVRL